MTVHGAWWGTPSPSSSPLSSLSSLSSSQPVSVAERVGHILLLVVYALAFAATAVMTVRAFRRKYSALHSLAWNRTFLVIALVAMFCKSQSCSFPPTTHTRAEKEDEAHKQ